MERVVLIKTCQHFAARREAIEETWAHALRCYGVDVWFVEGGHNGERSLDGVLHVGTGDDYGDNSQKLRAGLCLALALHHKAEAFFVCDDDTFVHPRRWLLHYPPLDDGVEFECRLYHPKSKVESQLNDGRPWATGGSGWYMSRRLAREYATTVTKLCSYDDVLAASVAQRCGARIDDRPDLYGGDRYTGLNDRVAADNRLITCHHVQPDEMLELYESTKGI